MSPAQRRDYQRLASRFCIAFQQASCDVRAAFGDPGLPLIAEIGFGMGETTALIAARRPECNFVGIEVYKPGIGKLLGLLESAGLTNVRIIAHDAVAVLQTMIAEQELDGVHIFFPDPWPKKRHHKRRLIQPGFVELLRRRLRRGAYVYLVTDWRDYAAQMLDVFQAVDGFRNPYGGFCDRRPWRPETSFERKGRDRAHAIHELWLERI
ncbi:MAG: tRNA (guanosine(46)-N7)-methyltransferase TrmB [Spirochaetaceae bacterium]|nr:MAG: tRNA (guanosine(46)-N7)-methyltransferase TrmB [Spirochaetaceae bacterium]